MTLLRQWMTTVILAGLIAAIGTIVFVSLAPGTAETSPDAVVTPLLGGDTNPQQPIIVDGTSQPPLSPVPIGTSPPTLIFDPTATTPPTKEYTVAFGDTLTDIAIAHRSTIEEIMEMNGLANPDQIEIGQVLTVPYR